MPGIPHTAGQHRAGVRAAFQGQAVLPVKREGGSCKRKPIRRDLIETCGPSAAQGEAPADFNRLQGQETKRLAYRLLSNAALDTADAHGGGYFQYEPLKRTRRGTGVHDPLSRKRKALDRFTVGKGETRRRDPVSGNTGRIPFGPVPRPVKALDEDRIERIVLQAVYGVFLRAGGQGEAAAAPRACNDQGDRISPGFAIRKPAPDDTLGLAEGRIRIPHLRRSSSERRIRVEGRSSAERRSSAGLKDRGPEVALQTCQTELAVPRIVLRAYADPQPAGECAA